MLAHFNMHSPTLHAQFPYHINHRFLWPPSGNVLLEHIFWGTLIKRHCSLHHAPLEATRMNLLSSLLWAFPEKQAQKALWQLPLSLPKKEENSSFLLAVFGMSSKGTVLLKCISWSKMVIQHLQMPVCYERTKKKNSNVVKGRDQKELFLLGYIGSMKSYKRIHRLQ